MMIEEKVKSTILDDIEAYEIGGEIYEVSPPSCATIIEMSAMASKLPQIVIDEGTDVLSSVLKYGKDSGGIVDIATLLILGSSGKVERKKFLFFERKVDRFGKLRSKLVNESPKRLEQIIGDILVKSEIDIFFRITTSLREANILTPTGGVVTASGQ